MDVNITKLLSDARKLGLAEADIATITAASEELNTAKSQLSTQQKSSSTYEARDLYNKKEGERVYRTASDLKEDKKRTKRRITDSHETIKEARKEKRDAFWKIASTKDRKKAIKAAKKKIKTAEESITSDTHHIADIELTLNNLLQKSKEAVTKATEKLTTYQSSVKTQLRTKATLEKMRTVMGKIDLNDPKYAPLIAFFNANSKKVPSLANPLPEVPQDILGILANINIERNKQTIAGIILGAEQVYTAAKGTAYKLFEQLTQEGRISANDTPKLNAPRLALASGPEVPALPPVRNTGEER